MYIFFGVLFSIIITLVVWILCRIVFKDSVEESEIYKTIGEVTSVYRGDYSEHEVIYNLMKYCNVSPRQIYHDLYICRHDGRYSQIDIIVTLPQGLLVIEVKNYKGWIYASGDSMYWCQVLGYGDIKHQFYNPLKQNFTHIEAIRHNLKQNPSVRIFNIVVFCGSCHFKYLLYNGNRYNYVITLSELRKLIEDINKMPNSDFGNKYEIINILSEGVKNGENPKIVNFQRATATMAKQYENSQHTYMC